MEAEGRLGSSSEMIGRLENTWFSWMCGQSFSGELKVASKLT